MLQFEIITDEESNSNDYCSNRLARPKSDRSEQSSNNYHYHQVTANKSSSSSLVNKENLNEFLTTKANEFFCTEKTKLAEKLSRSRVKKNPVLDDVSDMLKENQFIFREIDAFARKQNRLVSGHLPRVKDPAFKLIDREDYFQVENERLSMLLRSKNLKNKNLAREKDEESEDEDDEEFKVRNFYFKRNLTDKLAEKFYQSHENVKTKRNIMRAMFTQSAKNREKSCKLRFVGGNNNQQTTINERPKTRVDFNLDSTSGKKKFFIT